MKLYLADLIPNNHLSWLQAHFPQIKVGEVTCSWTNKSDGRFNTMASAVSSSVFSSKGTLRLDPADFPPTFSLGDPLLRETIVHELIHLEQMKRGFWYRLKMRFWNKTRKYEERPHEQEARTRAEAISQQWIQKA